MTSSRRPSSPIPALASLLPVLLIGCGSVPERAAPEPSSGVREPRTPDGVERIASDGASSTKADPAIDRSAPPDRLAPLRTPTARDTAVRRHRPGVTRLGDSRLLETSGLAVSRRDPGVLWAINDGGHAPALHALAQDGTPLGSWTVDARNRDWEDLAAFRSDGVAWLLIADTGDNGRRREELVLHLVAEPATIGPDAAPGTTLVPERSLRFRYEDGAHDVESVAVDETTGTVWLLPKAPVRGGRGVAGGAYALSLDATPPDEEALLVARRRATLADVPRGLVGALATSLAGIDLEQPTAFDIRADGRAGCLLTYRRLRCFERADGASWDETLSLPGRTLGAHRLEQAEALALDPDGRRAWFTSEGVTPPLRCRTVSGRRAGRRCETDAAVIEPRARP